MTMLTASHAKPQNFGAIEAAVKETACGRAFLADYARRVQQSDTLTMLAMLGRLERVCADLASRLAKRDAEKIVAQGQMMATSGGWSQPMSALLAVQNPTPSPSGYDPEAFIDRDAVSQYNARLNERGGNTMKRIDELAVALDNLHLQAVELAARYDGGDLQHESTLESSSELDPQGPGASGRLLPPLHKTGLDDHADEEILCDIAKALEPIP